MYKSHPQILICDSWHWLNTSLYYKSLYYATEHYVILIFGLSKKDWSFMFCMSHHLVLKLNICHLILPTFHDSIVEQQIWKFCNTIKTANTKNEPLPRITSSKAATQGNLILTCKIWRTMFYRNWPALDIYVEVGI